MESPYQPLLGTRPKLIAIFGLPGSGKTHLLNHLQQTLSSQHFAFFEGSSVIAKIMHNKGGIDAFHRLSDANKLIEREKAIKCIVDECTASGKIGVMSGHCIFWKEGKPLPDAVLTVKDLQAFTHVLYLDVEPQTIQERAEADRSRNRQVCSVKHLQKWAEQEKCNLRGALIEHGFLYATVKGGAMVMQKKVEDFIMDFAKHDEQVNTIRALDHLDSCLSRSTPIETMWVIDGDKTLTAVDTGDVLWREVLNKDNLPIENPVNMFFNNTKLAKYSYTAFRQVALMHSDHSPEDFKDLCHEAADKVSINQIFLDYFNHNMHEQHIGVVVITCGLAPLWRRVLDNAGLQRIPVIGSGQISHGFVVTPEVKTAIVQRLQQAYHMNVWAFGDSPLDLGMLKQAERAYVVVVDEKNRSKSMEKELFSALQNGLKANQIVLPHTNPPRLDFVRLPEAWIQTFSTDKRHRWTITVSHATDKPASQILTTASRDASLAGPALRQAHQQIGRYLALEYVADKVGLSTHAIRHVQGNFTIGHRLLHEDKTLIIPLMRGGEPMALGVSEVFPLAAFHHSKTAEDIQEKHLEGMRTVILVDSVINNGKSIAEYVNHIRDLRIPVRIVVVAGVVQEMAVVERGGLQQQLDGFGRLDLIALRLSSNKYTGNGKTDTGDRLFNTTHL
jgi:uracil phosphoribosyltransferase/adenylate kinase/phosphoserine phosphatase